MGWCTGGWCHYGWCSDAPVNTATCDFSITLPAITISLEGNLGLSSSLDITIPKTTLSLTGNTGSTSTFAFSIPKSSVSLTGNLGASSTFSLEIPLFTSSFTSTVGSVGELDITLPNIYAVLYGLVSPASTETKAVVVNLALDAITEYPDYGYNSFITLFGQVYGLNDSGIFPITGSTDNGTAIACLITSGEFDSHKGTERMASLKKIPRVAYPLCSSDGDLTVTLSSDKDAAYTYTVTEQEQSAKVIFGRGFRGRIFQWQLANVAGSSLELEHLRIKFDLLEQKSR